MLYKTIDDNPNHFYKLANVDKGDLYYEFGERYYKKKFLMKYFKKELEYFQLNEMMKKIRGTSINQLSILYNESTMINCNSLQTNHSTQGAIKKYNPTTQELNTHFSKLFFKETFFDIAKKKYHSAANQ